MAVEARAVALHVAVPLVACGQVWAALELAGVTLPSPAIVFALEGVVIAASVARARRAPPTPAGLARSWLAGVACFAVWAVLYFAAGHLVDPARAATIDDPWLARAPFVPALTSVYLGVHPFGLVPFCALDDADRVRRHLRGAIALVVTSSVVWLAWPVRLDRPTIPADASGFGAALLRGLHAVDPATNCFPSAHCAIATYAAIGLGFGRSRALFAWGVLTAVAIACSTILVRQHYVADVAAGVALAAIVGAVVHRDRGGRAARSSAQGLGATGGLGIGSGSGIGSA